MSRINKLFILLIVISLTLPGVVAVDFKDLSPGEISALTQLRDRNSGTPNEWSEDRFQEVVDRYISVSGSSTFKAFKDDGYSIGDQTFYGQEAVQAAALGYASEEISVSPTERDVIQKRSGVDVTPGSTVAELKRQGLFDDNLQQMIQYEQEVQPYYNEEVKDEIVDRALSGEFNLADELSNYYYGHEGSEETTRGYAYTAGHRMVFEALIDAAIVAENVELLDKLDRSLSQGNQLVSRTSDPEYETRTLRRRISRGYQQLGVDVTQADQSGGSSPSEDQSQTQNQVQTDASLTSSTASDEIEEGIYIVQRGDTLGEISSRSKIPFEFLVEENGEVTDRRGNDRELNPNIIHVGDRIIIPPKEVAKKYDKRGFNHPFGCEE